MNAEEEHYLQLNADSQKELREEILELIKKKVGCSGFDNMELTEGTTNFCLAVHRGYVSIGFDFQWRTR